MFRNVFLVFSLLCLLNGSSPASTSGVILDLETAKQLNATDDIVDEGNGTSFFQTSFENSTSDPDSGNDTLFWTATDTNETTEDSMMLQMDSQENQQTALEDTNDKTEALEEEENDVNKTQDSVFTETNTIELTEMDEKIVLQRENCHLEIAVRSTYDLKIQIKFDRLQNNTSGECCITLNGPENSLLAVLISNIHLYQNGSDGEVLKVITPNFGSAFVLKEYHSRTTYQPLLLTETSTVYLVLQYKVTTVLPRETKSCFNLEVLTYHRSGNYNQNRISGYSSAFSPTEGQKLYNFFT